MDDCQEMAGYLVLVLTHELLKKRSYQAKVAALAEWMTSLQWPGIEIPQGRHENGVKKVQLEVANKKLFSNWIYFDSKEVTSSMYQALSVTSSSNLFSLYSCM